MKATKIKDFYDQARYDGAVASFDQLCEQIAKLIKERWITKSKNDLQNGNS
jgi:hypothetical protein